MSLIIINLIMLFFLNNQNAYLNDDKHKVLNKIHLLISLIYFTASRTKVAKLDCTC